MSANFLAFWVTAVLATGSSASPWFLSQARVTVRVARQAASKTPARLTSRQLTTVSASVRCDCSCKVWDMCGSSCDKGDSHHPGIQAVHGHRCGVDDSSLTNYPSRSQQVSGITPRRKPAFFFYDER